MSGARPSPPCSLEKLARAALIESVPMGTLAAAADRRGGTRSKACKRGIDRWAVC